MTLGLLKIVVQAMDRKHGDDISVLDMKGVSLVADHFVICHGYSSKQVQAIAREVKDKVCDAGFHLKRLAGFDKARWILIDAGDVVVHIFHEEERQYYNLDKLWGDALRMDWAKFIDE